MTTSSSGRRTRTGSLGAIVVLCLLGGGALSGAAASTAPAVSSPTRSTVAAQAKADEIQARADAVSADAGIPPLPAQYQDNGIQFDPITATVAKAKVHFNMPPLVFRSYVLVCQASPTFHPPCPGHDVSSLPNLSFPYFWLDTFADNWVATRSGDTITYGVFPAVRVSLLAFGSIPSSATVHISQTVHNGLVDPMKLVLPIDEIAVPAGQSIPGFGPAPTFPQGQPFFAYDGVITGTVNVRISDVTVDGQPVDVGGRCQTATPALLKLIAPAGYYPPNVSPEALKGGPGEFQPLAGGGPGGYLQGKVDIPAFSGCRNGAENLDPLITGLVAGPGNPLDAYSPHGLQLWCLEPIAHCPVATRVAQVKLHKKRSLAQLRALLATSAGRAARTGGVYRRPRG